jgi:hypothetical protein
VLFRFAYSGALREHAKNALLSAHACARALKLLAATPAVEPDTVEAELYLVAALRTACQVSSDSDVQDTVL